MTARPSRRTVLAGAVSLPVLAACGSDSSTPSSPAPGTSAPATSAPTAGSATANPEALVALDEVPVGGSVVVEVPGGGGVVVARSAEDTVHGLNAVCTHEGCLVRSDGGELACPCHGSRFALADGAVLAGPAERPLPAVTVRVDGADVVLG